MQVYHWPHETASPDVMLMITEDLCLILNMEKIRFKTFFDMLKNKWFTAMLTIIDLEKFKTSFKKNAYQQKITWDDYHIQSIHDISPFKD